MTEHRYRDYPDHPLHNVSGDVLDVARRVLLDAAVWKDVDKDMAIPIADAVIAELIEAGFVVVPHPKTTYLADLIEQSKCALRSFDSQGSSYGSSLFTSLADIVDYLEGRIDDHGDPVDEPEVPS